MLSLRLPWRTSGEKAIEKIAISVDQINSTLWSLDTAVKDIVVSLNDLRVALTLKEIEKG